ncbi:Similar to Uncharacterized transcriptional regulatory protein C139.03; acc. no. Q9UTN0 [Pyronema omphalodes CBS 100304]|uniref:Similar to Uncharacterized transcriptional regulatory protein C139.03 acc. no. Q9UTN0 n=1 Tax=Pyronema omphalodes (strain CBS 100304) TaxID=1076935 RepID=U4L8T5_PYROM|nr:Similar to Uncharacterized transcriptional regulatory protein C139.03; acc. no. Q9UTN0 [Pyronema omphalodes CBS 100304]
MVEMCVYSDNTGKGAANKEKNKNRDRSAGANCTNGGEKHRYTAPSESPPKRLRTNSGASVASALSSSCEDSTENYRGHSRSSSLNQLHKINESPNMAPYQEPRRHSVQHIQHPPPPSSIALSNIIKEGELENRVNRLAEIVDQCYRFAAYNQSQPSSPVLNMSPEVDHSEKNGQLSQWPPQQIPNMRSGSVSFAREAPQHLVQPVQSTYQIPNNTPVQLLPPNSFAPAADKVAMGHLSIQEDGRSRYVGTSFWALLSNEITELNRVLRSSSKSDPPRTPGNGLNSPPHSRTSLSPDGSDPRVVSSSSPITTNDTTSILKLLPAKHQCDTLLKSFLQGVHPIVPLIHVPSFLQEWRSFWSSSEEAPEPSPSFLPLLLAVLYAGAVSISPKSLATSFDNRTKEAVMSDQLQAATTSLEQSGFLKSPTINGLLGYLLVQTCLVREEEPLGSCAFIGTAMRVAQQMGLHRDGSVFGLSPVESEVRRRIWWHILHLDIQGAIATGLPPLGGSSEEQFDTRMPSELRDELIGVDSPEDLPTSGSRYSPTMVLAVGRYETTALLRKIVVRLLGIKPPTKEDMTEMGSMILGLKSKLEQKIARIPTREEVYMSAVSAGEQSEGDAFNKWARVMLSMMSDRAYVVLYQPFLKNSRSRLWFHARHFAVRASESFLRSYTYLARTPLFEAYTWYLPGTYQPLHALMILLLDLAERPLEESAPRSRVVGEIFSIFQNNEGEEWRMLERLRRKSVSRAPDTVQAGQGAGYYQASIFGFGFEAPGQAQGFHTQQEMDDIDRLVREEREQATCVQPEQLLKNDMEQQMELELGWEGWEQVFGRFTEGEGEVGTGWGLVQLGMEAEGEVWGK